MAGGARVARSRPGGRGRVRRAGDSVRRALAGFGRFWWDFIVGDDWRIAAGVMLALALGAVLVAATDVPDAAIATVTAVATIAVAIASIVSTRP
jgi:hypothetical protein